LQQYGNINAEKAYLWWNMGNGMLLTVSPDHADRALQSIVQHLNGYQAQVAGRITNQERISIKTATVSLEYV